MTTPRITAIRALAALHDVRKAAAAATLPAETATVLDRLIKHAAKDARAERPFVIKLDRLALETGQSHAAVAQAVAALMSAGWLALDADARWAFAIAPDHLPAGRPAVPAPEQP